MEAAPTTLIDPQGHTVVIDGDTTYYSIHGSIHTLTTTDARDWWRKSATARRSNQRPVTAEAIQAGRRHLRAW